MSERSLRVESNPERRELFFLDWGRRSEGLGGTGGRGVRSALGPAVWGWGVASWEHPDFRVWHSSPRCPPPCSVSILWPPGSHVSAEEAGQHPQWSACPLGRSACWPLGTLALIPSHALTSAPLPALVPGRRLGGGLRAAFWA